MIVPKRFTLDTNILVYGVDVKAAGKHKLALSLIASAAEKDCLLTVQTLGEFCNVAQRKEVASIDKAVAITQTWQQVFPVVSANQDTFNEAIEYVRDHNISFWDAMLWVTAKQAGCAFLLSEDMQHGRRLGGVEVLNPFIRDSDAAMTKLLG